MRTHVGIDHFRKVSSFDHNGAVLLLHDERCALTPDQVHQPHLLQRGVIEPERTAFSIPAAQIEIGLGELEGIEDDVVSAPVLSPLYSQGVEVQASTAGEDLHFGRASEFLGLDADRNMVLAKGFEL